MTQIPELFCIFRGLCVLFFLLVDRYTVTIFACFYAVHDHQLSFKKIPLIPSHHHGVH